MATQRNDSQARQARIDSLIEQVRANAKQALLRRGIALWTGTEAEQRIARHDRPVRPAYIN